MNSQPPLRGCFAKLDRAQEHLDVLGEVTLDFLRSHPFELRGEVDKENERYSVRISVKKSPPERLGLIVGDAIQNLRAALDHLVTSLAVLGGATETWMNQFPIFRQSPSSKRERDTWNRMLTNVPDEARIAIEQMQPYNRPSGVEISKHSLWIVKRLSNEDKHRVVLRALMHVLDADSAPFDAIPKFEPVTDVGSPRNLRISSLGPLDREVELYSADVEVLGPKPKLKMRGALPIETIYGEDLVPGRRLESASKRVRGAIENFVPLFNSA